MTPPTEIGQQLAALRDGRLTLEEAAKAFRQRRWRSGRGAVWDAHDSSADDGASQRSEGEVSRGGRSDPLPDPGASVPGSIDEITAAYDRGELTRHQYRVLAHAVAEAINAEVNTDT